MIHICPDFRSHCLWNLVWEQKVFLGSLSISKHLNLSEEPTRHTVNVNIKQLWRCCKGLKINATVERGKSLWIMFYPKNKTKLRGIWWTIHPCINPLIPLNPFLCYGVAGSYCWVKVGYSPNKSPVRHRVTQSQTHSRSNILQSPSNLWNMVLDCGRTLE